LSWSIRHQGSRRTTEGLEDSDVVAGLEDGLWEGTDEVKGPDEKKWQALEEHPHFAEIVYELEPPLTSRAEDETRLDMNPLIDVTLVLLIFFILTTSYAALQRLLESPRLSTAKVEGLPQYTPKRLAEFTVKVTARRESGKPVIRVEDHVVEPANLVAELRRFVKERRRTTMWLDIADDMKYGTEIQIRDAAKGAGIERVLVAVKR
jgi:biopolymer transport protein ExbD